MGQAGCTRFQQKYYRKKLNDELVEIYRQSIHSKVFQPLFLGQLVT